MGKIYSDITETIGRTPLVKLNKLAEGIEANVVVKLESANPANSVKDRIGAAIIDDAVASGALTPGGTIVEGTSGNTGIALAMVAAARGFKTVICMPESMSVERRAVMRAYGAELILTPAAEGMKGAVAKAEEVAAERDNAVLARQFGNPANVDIHRRTTGEEIWEDTDGNIDIFVAGIGTGGTISGAGETLRGHKSDVEIVAVEPKDSPLLTEGKAGPHKIQGLGANFVPEILNRDIYNEVIDVTFEDSLDVARKLGTEEGVLAGVSAGANVWGALEVAKRPENKGKTIVVIVPDFGERYLSTPLFEEYRK
ncbi:cysteine synthase A [Dietzia timorensis]|uniref:Cysteine synthase n=1 Tax=Dietzia timorensis TaxID=499555 RepID=A0A173LI59_9ACTN|nr:cysteine synthase A [Dietzia timorensis]ANI90977.1 O-acetylserine sulfhydrylase [Dietzia timorensis]